MKFGFLGLVALLLPAYGYSQSAINVGADFEGFEHTPVQSKNIFSTRTTDTLEHLRLAAGLAFNFEDDPVVVRFTDGREWRVVDHRVTGNVYAAIGLFDRLEFALSAPVILSQDAQSSPETTLNTTLDAFAMGDLRLHGHFVVLRRAGFGVGLAATGYLPTGAQSALTSDGTTRIEPKLVVDYRWDALTLAANASYMTRPSRQAYNFVSGDQVRWSAAVDFAVSPTFHVAGSSYGSVGLDDALKGDARNTPAEFLLGPRVFLPLGLMVHAAAGTGLTRSVGAPDFRIVAGVEWAPDPLNGQHTGSDEDVVAVASEPDEELSLPDCAQDPGAYGCPQPDADDDGIPDAADACPAEPEDADGFQDEDGCPDLDNDADGILDVNDACPLDPEVINGVLDDDGCPDEGSSKVRVTGDRIEILERVYFETAKDVIQPQSYDVLEQVARVMAARPDITRLRVEGHTDDRGKDSYNLDLSQRRAAAVRAFLIEKGVDAQRLVARGYGESHPIGDNKTAQGRDINRRVEFHIIAVESK
ncbi:MAG: OmpA family protein [bacterium]